MKKYLYTLLFAIASIALILGTEHIFGKKTLTMTLEEEKAIEKSEAKKLMIVAHPDDEMIWGGAHLLEDKYFVVCITNGNNGVRASEFKKVLKATDDDGIILRYPDKTNGERDNWEKVYEKISEDLSKVIKAKEWELVVTHNPNGEYGHKHHIMTNSMVSDICMENEKTDILHYFGIYYKKVTLESNNIKMEDIGEELLKKKEEVLKIYDSQGDTVEKLGHMNKYENWLSFDEWENK